MKRTTLKQINAKIARHGYKLVRSDCGTYFYYWPLDDSHQQLYDDKVDAATLSWQSVEEWESLLLRKIEETY